MGVTVRPYTIFYLLLGCALSVQGQRLSPLQGQGWPPVGGTTVYVSAVIDRMLAIDDNLYRFEAVVYLYLSWQDPRAEEALINGTAAAEEAGSCKKPCSMEYAWMPGERCCDHIFLPHFDVTNVRAFSSSNVVRYGIIFENGAVGWWTHLQGEFYTPFQFHAFPFDDQYLIIQLELAEKDANVSPIYIKESLTGVQMYQPGTGDRVAGWDIKSLYVVPFNTSFLAAMLHDSSLSAPGDPLPLAAAEGSQGGFDVVSTTSNHTGFNIVIVARRVSVYYLITALLPIILNVYLSLLVSAVHPKHLGTRLGVIVTFFLTLTAVLYSVSGSIPEASTALPIQQLAAVSYVVLALVGVLSFLVFEMIELPSNRRATKRAQRASRQFDKQLSNLLTARQGAAQAGGSVAKQPSAAGLRRRRRRQQGNTEPAVSGGNMVTGHAGGGGHDIPAAVLAVPDMGDGSSAAQPRLAAGRSGSVRHTSKDFSDEDEGARLNGCQPLAGLGAVPDPLVRSRAKKRSSDTDSTEGSSLSDASSCESEELQRAGCLGCWSTHQDDDEEAPKRSRDPDLNAGVAAESGDAGAKAASKSRGLLRWLSRCKPAWLGVRRANTSVASARKLSWLGRQRLMLTETAAEMGCNKHFALHLALKLQRYTLGCLAVLYGVACIVIFVVGSQNNNQLPPA
ncbi:hypothetical protein N2152v2_010301 [Parachlorella kessleri]